MSMGEFPSPIGDFWMMTLDSLGIQRWTPASGSGAPSNFNVLPSVQCKAESAFDKQWFAYFNATIAGVFSDDIFVGVDPPRYIDGTTGQVYRVTSDAPGATGAASDLAYATFNIAAASTGLQNVGLATGILSLD